MSKQKTIAVDLDDVICHRSGEYEHLGVNKYDFCVANVDMVCVVNSLYDDGHHIVIYTARGMSQFEGDVETVRNQLFDKTTRQLEEWQVRYHELVMGKIHYDLLIDDKALNSIGITKQTIEEFLHE